MLDRYLADWRKEIVALDSEDVAGLKSRHQLPLLMDECAELMQAQDFEGAKEKAKEVLELPGLPDHQKQGVYFVIGMCCQKQKNLADAAESFEKALKVDPNGKMAPALRAKIEEIEREKAGQKDS